MSSSSAIGIGLAIMEENALKHMARGAGEPPERNREIKLDSDFNLNDFPDHRTSHEGRQAKPQPQSAPRTGGKNTRRNDRDGQNKPNGRSRSAAVGAR